MQILSGRLFAGVRNFFADKSAQDLIEYALVVAVISLGSIAGLNSVATSLMSAYTNIDTTFSYWVL